MPEPRVIVEIPFTTVALQGKTYRQTRKAGYLCVWDDQITFIRSHFIQWVTPLTFGAITAFLPRGPDDPRTVARFPLATLATFSDCRDVGFKGGFLHGHKIHIQSRDGHSLFYGGGQLNGGLTFTNMAPVVRAALAAQGLPVSESEGILTVQPVVA